MRSYTPLSSITLSILECGFANYITEPVPESFLYAPVRNKMYNNITLHFITLHIAEILGLSPYISVN